jgi:23S rRNA (adenine2030-N6)-methyltransferase
MNYRHGYHAGNFADVVKHIALIAILMHLKKKEAPFAVIDTHAGRGSYDLSGEQAKKTGEAEGGIKRLRGLASPLPPALAAYLEIEGQGANYPGSPLVAAKLLRPADRLVAIEKHPEEAALLRAVLAPWRKASVEEGDGYARLLKLLPPPERRGLILIDPPFEAVDEFEQLANAVRGAHRRFATGITLIWYPIKAPGEAEAFVGEVLAGGAGAALTIEIAIDASPASDAKARLSRAGLLVLNPPFGFAEEMAAILARLEPALAARTKLERRAG